MKGMNEGVQTTYEQRLARLKEAGRIAGIKKKIELEFSRGIMSLIPSDWKKLKTIDGDIGVRAPEDYLQRLRAAHIAYDGE